MMIGTSAATAGASRYAVEIVEHLLERRQDGEPGQPRPVVAVLQRQISADRSLELPEAVVDAPTCTALRCR
jgi:hypothetical protein